MFTGIVEELGTVVALTQQQDQFREAGIKLMGEGE